jgi:hypothetical protein
LQETNLQEHIKYVRMVGLSAKQQQDIADGFAVFSRLLEPVLQVGPVQKRPPFHVNLPILVWLFI